MTISNDPASAVGTQFTAEEYDETYPPGYELHYWHRARGSVLMDRVRDVCRKGDTVLEIGAGRGHYVGILRAAGYDAYGCDLGHPHVHDDVRPFYFAGTDAADLDPDLRRRVTAVLLLDVIEHIERPSDFFASIFQALPALAVLIIAVPARQEIWSNYDEHFRHFLRYDIRKFREMARASHLSIESWSYFFHALYLPAWILKRLGLKRRTTFVAPGTPWLHSLLGRAFWLESRLLPKSLYGTSLLCVCRPEARRD